MDSVGLAHRIVLNAAARTPDGMVIVNLWPTRERSEAASRDSRRAEAMAALALDPSQIAPEHYDLERYRVFRQTGLPQLAK